MLLLRASEVAVDITERSLQACQPIRREAHAWHVTPEQSEYAVVTSSMQVFQERRF